MAIVRPKVKDTVFVKTLGKYAQILKIEYDPVWGPQICVRVKNSSQYPESHDDYWIVMDDIAQSNVTVNSNTQTGKNSVRI